MDALESLQREHLLLKWMLADLRLDLLRREFARKAFDPNQPRAPAGHGDESGRWTSDGGGSSAVVTADRRTRVAQLATPGGSLSDADFDPSKPGWHEYTAGPNQVCAAHLRCAREEIADQLARFSVPGRNPARPVEHHERSPVYGHGIYAGEVRSTIDDDGLRITNRTLEGHYLFDGVVIRSARQASDGSWHVTTHGFGNNVIPGMNAFNELAGPEVFNDLDRQMRANIERHRAKGFRFDAIRAMDDACDPVVGRGGLCHVG